MFAGSRRTIRRYMVDEPYSGRIALAMKITKAMCGDKDAPAPDACATQSYAVVTRSTIAVRVQPVASRRDRDRVPCRVLVEGIGTNCDVVDRCVPDRSYSWYRDPIVCVFS